MDELGSRRREQFLSLYTANEPAIRAFVRRLAPTRADVNLRRDFLEYLNVDAALAEHAALPEGDLIGPHGARDVDRRFRPGPSLVVAAVVLLLVATVIWVGRSVWNGSRVVAVEVLSADQVELEGRETALHQGERLMVSRLQVRRGSLRVQLESGVVLDLLGPVAGVFEGPGRFRLVHGGLNVDVGSHGKGFTVATAAGDVEDLGTRFGVSVSQSGKADIAVFSGEVRVREPGVGVVTVSEGEALRLHVGREADRLLTVPLKREEMALEAAGVAPAVRDIAADARGEIYVEYTVWRAHVPAGGSIELGPPHVRGEGGAKVMFGIAVKPDESYTNRHKLTGGER